MQIEDFVERFESLEVIYEFKTMLIASETSMCDFAMVINGIITNQNDMYQGGDSYAIKTSVNHKVIDIAEALSYSTNVTFHMPVSEEFDLTGIVSSYLSA